MGGRERALLLKRRARNLFEDDLQTHHADILLRDATVRRTQDVQRVDVFGHGRAGGSDAINVCCEKGLLGGCCWWSTGILFRIVSSSANDSVDTEAMRKS